MGKINQNTSSTQNEQSSKRIAGTYIVIAALVFILVVGLVYFLTSNTRPEKYDQAVTEKTEKLEMWLRETALQEAMLSVMETVGETTLAEVYGHDGLWKDQGESYVFANVMLGNDLSKTLRIFRGDNPEFPEIFITDARGANIGMTNVTSDYYQADEEWWVKTYAEGEGLVWAGSVEFDESAAGWVVPLYLPVYGTQGDVIGIVKALVNTSQLY